MKASTIGGGGRSANTAGVSLQAPESREPTLRDEMHVAMALSNLIFLYADVRLMSQTGRISLPFEWIAVDSDYTPRYKSEQLAVVSGAPTKQSSISPLPEQNAGCSTAQIMACLLLELRNRVEKEARHDAGQTLHSDDEFATYTHELKNEKSASVGDSMHSMLKAWAEMVGRDLNTVVPHIEARRSAVHSLILQEDSSATTRRAFGFKSRSAASAGKDSGPHGSFLNSVPEGDEEKEEDDKWEDESDVEDDSDRFFGKLEFGEKAAKRLEKLRLSQVRSPDALRQSKLQHLKSLRKEMVMNEKDRTNKHFQELNDAVFGMGVANHALRQSVAASHVGVNATVDLSPDQLQVIMRKAVASRQYNKLAFMRQFFRQGTVSQLMVGSQCNIVWMGDWFPAKELTFAIAVDTVKKRVIVVFRGAITKQDWSKALDLKLRKAKNPIEEDFEGKPDHIKYHSGFYRYLFRKREDSGTTKYDEVAYLAHKYGTERIGTEYQLVICGHSLGAGLSTVFSLHASCEDRFTRNGPLKVFTFGSPYVGNHEFVDCWRHQEKTNKLQCARFFNSNDLFTYVPTNTIPTKRGSQYRHVGIGVRIKAPPIFFNRCRKYSPYLFYVGDEGACSAYWRNGIRNNVMFNTTWPWRMKQMHTLAELQYRMMEASEREDSEENLKYLNMSISALYQLLSDENFVTVNSNE